MRALSMRQPWAHAVVHLGKRIENRAESSSAFRQLRNYREPFLIHASASTSTMKLGAERFDFTAACDAVAKNLDDEAWVAFRDEYLDVRMSGGRAVFLPREGLELGGIVGRAKVAGLIDPFGNLVWGEDADRRWHIRGQYGIVLGEVAPLPFMDCKGALGLWECGIFK